MRIEVRIGHKVAPGFRTKKYRSAAAVADALRGVSAHRVTISVELDTPAEFDELMAALPIIKETMSHKAVKG